jgi:hypothetical protein
MMFKSLQDSATSSTTASETFLSTTQICRAACRRFAFPMDFGICADFLRLKARICVKQYREMVVLFAYCLDSDLRLVTLGILIFFGRAKHQWPIFETEVQF